MHRTGSREEWRAARLALLAREKELTRMSDELARERQAVPWVPVETEYVFDRPAGRRTLAEIEAYRDRMGWTVPWASSHGSSFSFDFHVATSPERPLREYFAPAPQVAVEEGELPGMSAFALQDGVVHHTYSAYARGLDALWGVYQWLDRAPLGRNEADDPAWMRRHDEYEAGVA